LDKQVDKPGGLLDHVRAARAKETALVLVMDANAHPQLVTQKAMDDSNPPVVTEPGERSVWRTLHGESKFSSVWDGHFDASGHSVGPCPTVTTNKVRGPSTDQVAKIGVHAYCCIDHVYFGSEQLSFNGFPVAPARFPSEEAALFQSLPSLTIPSDHYPVVVDLKWHSQQDS